ncbi:uncharacterized protein [Ptychodera flava]|uniref:uncharacterized protein isoform X2 n=1 Tax=Ptychodera flava TaxID=63121 RepID=UPI003969F81A
MEAGNIINTSFINLLVFILCCGYSNTQPASVNPEHPYPCSVYEDKDWPCEDIGNVTRKVMDNSCTEDTTTFELYTVVIIILVLAPGNIILLIVVIIRVVKRKRNIQRHTKRNQPHDLAYATFDLSRIRQTKNVARPDEDMEDVIIDDNDTSRRYVMSEFQFRISNRGHGLADIKEANRPSSDDSFSSTGYEVSNIKIARPYQSLQDFCSNEYQGLLNVQDLRTSKHAGVLFLGRESQRLNGIFRHSKL